MLLSCSKVRGGRTTVALACCLLACGSDRSVQRVRPPASPVSPAAPSGAIPAAAEPGGFATATQSPSWAAPGELLLPACRGYERSLMGAARRVAERQAQHQPPAEISELVAGLRASGSPHVWPRVWSLQGAELTLAHIQTSFAEWLGQLPSGRQLRCGVARHRGSHGEDIVAAVVAEALADLDAFPEQASLGQWLRLRARLLEPATSGKVVLLGPLGAPRTVPSSFHAGEIRATFALDQPGLWRTQLLLDTAAGPRPALEAWTFVDVEPSLEALAARAPGEDLDTGEPGRSVSELQRTLFDMLNRARRSEQMAPLRRDSRLDQLARAHAEAMRARGRTAHDVGAGLPAERLRSAGLVAERVGENVARARSLARAHRALWDSPAHRGNLLDPGYEAVGVGVAVELERRTQAGARDSSPGHSVWVCQLFASYRD